MIHFCGYKIINVFFKRNSFMISNIMLYLGKKLMTKIKAKKLSLKFIPYLFVAVTILTTLGTNNGIWA